MKKCCEISGGIILAYRCGIVNACTEEGSYEDK